MQNTTPKIYAFFPYDRSAKIRWLMREMDLPFENHWLNRENQEIESPEYLAINPMGRIPAIAMNGQTMFESGAICAQLADQHLEKGMAPALNAPERMQYNQWMYFAAATLEVFMTRVMITEEIPAGKVFDEKTAALHSDVEESFQVLDKTLASKSFLVGDRMSAADICVGYHLYWMNMWPEFKAMMDKRPHLTAYLARMQARPAAISVEVFSYVE